MAVIITSVPDEEARMLTVSEIFHSIQGESTYQGSPCVFVRLAGCNLRCRWCDTEYSFTGGRPMSRSEVLQEVGKYRCRLVEITGGEPLLQDEAIPLMEELGAAGYTVMLETSGAEPIEAVPEGVIRVVDVKCPGSGESERNRWENLEQLRKTDEVKFVIADREDFDWAVELVDRCRLAVRCTVLFSPVSNELADAELAGWILEDGLSVRLNIQMHKVLWPYAERGV